MTRLKRIHSDATHNQEIAKKRIIAKLKDGSFVGTADLSSATDRFPVQLTYHMLKAKGVKADD